MALAPLQFYSLAEFAKRLGKRARRANDPCSGQSPQMLEESE